MRPVRLIRFHVKQKSQNLDGFPKPHIIGQTRSQSQPIEELQPLHAILLVGTKRRLEIRDFLGGWKSVRALQRLEYFRDAGPRDDFRPFHSRSGSVVA